MGIALGNKIAEKIRDVPDYPKKGIIFKDITPLLRDKHAFKECINMLKESVDKLKPDYIVGIESRGFIVGAALAYAMDIGFVPARKVGKLPYEKISRTYTLEYGDATLEMHSDAVKGKERILIVDDLLATGGTAKAASELVNELGGDVVGFAFIIELKGLDGRSKLDSGEVISLIEY